MSTFIDSYIERTEESYKREILKLRIEIERLKKKNRYLQTRGFFIG